MNLNTLIFVTSPASKSVTLSSTANELLAFPVSSWLALPTPPSKLPTNSAPKSSLSTSGNLMNMRLQSVTQMRSSDYWQQRWSEKGSIFRQSWPDDQMRWLELRFIAKILKQLPLSLGVTEFGCGPFTFSEDQEILRLIHESDVIYCGIDSSLAAIDRAKHVYGPDAIFYHGDLADPAFAGSFNQNVILLSRRFLQNLTREERKLILPICLQFKHGILIECCRSGFTTMNLIRGFSGLPRLEPPEFNNYLTDEEEALIRQRAGVEVDHFASLYYLLTRGVRQPKEFNTQYHFRASSLSRDFPTDVCFGPLKGFWW